MAAKGLSLHTSASRAWICSKQLDCRTAWPQRSCDSICSIHLQANKF